MRATEKGSGKLQEIPDCSISVPGFGEIRFNNLPDISDSKSVAYNDEPVIGRAVPLKTYSHSENRAISLTIHLLTLSRGDAVKNLKYLRALESCAYPRDGNSSLPFKPPPVCKIKCGSLLGDDGVCVVMKNYSVRFPVDMPWDTRTQTYLPTKLDVETTWDVVYNSENLPGQERILRSGS